MSRENPLVKAIFYGRMEEARELFRNGEKFPDDLNEYDRDSIIRNLLQNKAFDLFEVLIDQKQIVMDVYECDRFDSSTFRTIASQLKEDHDTVTFFTGFVQRLSNINDEVEDQTLLGFFLHKGADLAFIKCLVEAGCDVHYKNNAEQNFIHQVINHPFNHDGRGMAYVQYLIDQGVDMYAADLNGATPLHIAVYHHKQDYIKLLMENGANPNERDKRGESAFFLALNNKEVYEQLTQYASPNFELRTNSGEDMLGYYMRSFVYSASKDTLGFIARLLQDGADPYQTSPYYDQQKSPLDWAAEKAEPILRTFLETVDVDINRQDDKGNTLLHKVCAYDVNWEAEKAKEIYKKVKMLIEKGADVNASNDQNETPFMLASKDNLKIKTVELLMQNGAKAGS